jgi:NADPH:quinone reductase-like Zn-dependent oxidoreductase
MPRFPEPAAAYAEFVVAPSRQLARIPDSVSDLTAAAVALSGLTAYQSIVDTLEVGKDSRVLIHGAAGDVGRVAVQIAKARRAEVWATEVPGRMATLVGLGVDHAIDAGTEDFTDLATGMDAVLDLVGSDGSAARLLRTLRPGGRLLSLPAPEALPTPADLEGTTVDARWMLVEPDYQGLEALSAMLEYGLLRIAISDVRRLDEVAALHAIGEAGEATGRLVATLTE